MSRNPGHERMATDWREKEIFTTGEAARICNVSHQTIIRSFDAGRLRGFRVPGSRFRRIPRADLLRFLRENRMPVDALERGRRRVLVICPEGGRRNHLAALFEGDGRYDVAFATTAYDAGLLTGRFRPELVLVQDGISGVEGESVAKGVVSISGLERTIVVALQDPPDPEDPSTQNGVPRPRARRAGSRLERLALDGPALLACIAETLNV